MNWTVEVDAQQWVVRDGAGGRWVEPVQWSDMETVRVLLGKVLGLDVAEHHVLAAHGEGLFSGLGGAEQEWAERLVGLLEHADRLRSIVAEWPQGHMMMSRTELKGRGWNDAIMGELLRPAAVLANPHYASGGDMVLFDTRRVFEAERSTAWIQATARLRSQRIVRASQPAASRAARKQAVAVAAMDPAACGAELVDLATSAATAEAAVRAVALDALRRHWRGREWSLADLDVPEVAQFAALLGDEAVVSAAVGHDDPRVARVAARRVLDALAG